MLPGKPDDGGAGSAPAPGAVARPGTVKYEEPRGTMALSYLQRGERRYQGPEYRPQPRHAGSTRRGVSRVSLTVQRDVAPPSGRRHLIFGGSNFAEADARA